jgi:hypothetical protein
MIFVGVDWAEAHHDVCVLDEDGRVLSRGRIPDSLEGLRQFYRLVGDHEPEEVIIGIEKDRGLIVTALVAAGFTLYAINPMSASRYRDRHHAGGAKSDPGDAKMLADLVRTDRHNHRTVAADSTLAEALKVLARSHQNLIWERQRHANALRNALKDCYPAALEAFGVDLTSHDAIAVLSLAPTPADGRRLTKARVVTALRRGGRQRGLERKAAEVLAALHVEQLRQPEILEHAYGRATKSEVRVIEMFGIQIAELETDMAKHFGQHPDAKIIRSLPGMGMVLGARVLGEFGDDPNRYANARSRKNYAGTSPITRASGRSKVVLARHACNKRLVDALNQWAFCSLRMSPGARRYYDELRARDKTHSVAIRQVANRWVGVLHACLENGCLYDEEIAWSKRQDLAA